MSGEQQAVPLAGEAFLNAIPEEFRGHTALAPIKDMPNLVKSYINAQSMVGADKLVLPKADAPDADWAPVYQKLGRPEAPDKYGFEVPKDLPEGINIDKDTVARVSKMFHDSGLTQRQAKALFNQFIASQVETYKKGQDEYTESRNNFMTTLKKEHGEALDVKLAQARQVVVNLGGKEFQGFLEESGLGDHPQMVKLMLTLGELMANDTMIRDKFANAGFISNAEEAKAEIGKLQADAEFMKQYTDNQNPGHSAAVARMSRLYGVGYPGKAQF